MIETDVHDRKKNVKDAKLKAFSSELSFQGAELFSIILQESIHKKFFEICPMMQKMMLQPEDINVLNFFPILSRAK